MANFGTFDLASAYSAAEDVKAARQNQRLRGLQIEGAELALEKARQPKKLEPEQYLQNRRAFVALLQQARGDLGNLEQYVDFAEKNDWIQPGVKQRVLGLPPEQLVAGIDTMIADLSEPPEEDALATSEREYLRAQKDPGYAQWLKDRKAPRANPPSPPTYTTRTEREVRGGKPYAREVQINTRNPKDRHEGPWFEQEPRARNDGGMSDYRDNGGLPSAQEPAQKFEEGQTAKSNSGKPIIYRNGQWVYQ